jgi:hypothetical protein
MPMHKISTIFYRVKRVMGLMKHEEADMLIAKGLTDSFEPSQESMSNILSFSRAYKHEKSENIGDIEYLIN